MKRTLSPVLKHATQRAINSIATLLGILNSSIGDTKLRLTLREHPLVTIYFSRYRTSLLLSLGLSAETAHHP